MLKSKLLPVVLALVAGISVLAANFSAYACWPLMSYQPKAPKSLIKVD